MSAFQQALADSSAIQSGSSMSTRGTAAGNPSARGLGTALRAAGIRPEAGMELDGGGGRPTRGAGKRVSIRSYGGPLDQTGRHRPPKAPYAKIPNDRNDGAPRRGRSAPDPSGPLAARMSHAKIPINPNSRRDPVGTPRILDQGRPERMEAQKAAHSRLNEKLGSEEMKTWLRSRVLQEGVMNMSGLPDDPWLKEQGILAPGHQDAPREAGYIFWKLIDNVIQRPSTVPIHTLSLSNNNFDALHHLTRLPYCLPHLRALDLSHNPIRRVAELDELLAQGERKGKATAGVGSLKSLTELKLNGCLFREQILGHAKGAETYQHEILRRFPGLLILDGVNLNRVVFGIERKPKLKRTDEVRAVLQRSPFTFPIDVQAGFMDTELVKGFVMSFCGRFFPLFDQDRAQLLPAYSPNATISVSANTLPSYSLLAQQIKRTPHSRPNPVAFTSWTEPPGRNFLRNAASIDQRVRTLKSPADDAELVRWWAKAVPKTKHPLEEASKWCIDAWVLDGEGVNTKLCAMIEGEFQEMPSGTYRTFSRTFILADAPEGSPANVAGFPATVLSDTTVVHSYMSTGAFDSSRSLAVHGVVIKPPQPRSSSTEDPAQAALVAQLRQRTGMNAQFAAMCLVQNGWVFGTALQNFEEIKSSIPAEAFQG